MKQIFTLETGYRTTCAGPVECTADGRVLWLTTGPDSLSPGAFHLSRVELRESKDCGQSWGPPRILLQGTKDAAPGPMALVRLRSGRLAHLSSLYGGYSEDHDPGKSLNEGYVQCSEDDGATWSNPTKLPTGERYLSSVLSCAQTSTGRIVFPFGYLTPEQGRFVVSALYSDDEGETWRRSPSILDAGGEGFESGACEPSAVELPDGRLWMLIRAQTGFQWESFSSDKGVTWEAARPSAIPSSNAPAVLLRLSSGSIVMAWNNCVGLPYARHSLALAASEDGRNFYGFREIAHTDYPMTEVGKYWCVTYPYLCEAPDGRILVSFNQGNWDFNQARLARIDPTWLEETRFVEDFREGRGAWCGLGATGSSLVAPEDDQPGAALEITHGDRGPCGMVRNFPLLANGEMQVTGRVLEPEAYLLWHDSLLNPGGVDEACIRVRFGREGRVFVGAGTPVTRATEQEAWRPKYSYLAYPIEKEALYPQRITLGERFVLVLRCDRCSGEARLAINKGPEAKMALGRILGLSYLGVAVGQGGSIRLRRMETCNT